MPEAAPPQLTRSAALTDYVEVARAVGLDPYRLADGVGIPRAALSDPDLKISADAVRRLLEASAERSGAEDFGLRIAERRRLSNLGALALIAREQPTIRKAVEAIGKHLWMQNELLVLRLQDAGDLVMLDVGLMIPADLPARQSVELTLGALCRTLRALLLDSWRPEMVCFTHAAPKDARTHRRVLGPAVVFDQAFNGVACAARDLDAPIAGADPAMARQVERYLDQLAARPHLTTADRVRELVIALLPGGQCTVERVAQHLGVDRRTVHRQLDELGTSFSRIVAQVRGELALAYLGGEGLPLAVISERLGFSALSAFSRWFRTHHGCSASDWRRRSAAR